MVDLVFRGGPLGNSPVDLVFGQTELELISGQAAIVATLPGLTLSAIVDTANKAVLVAVLPAMTFAATASYVSNTARPLVGKVDSDWQVASKIETGAQCATQDGSHLYEGPEMPWSFADHCNAAIDIFLPHTFIKTRAGSTFSFQDAQQLVGIVNRDLWADMVHGLRLNRSSQFQTGDKRSNVSSARWQDMLRDRRPKLDAKWQEGTFREIEFKAPWQVASPMLRGWASREREAIRPPAGISMHVVVPPVNPDLCYTPPLGSLVHFLFDHSHGTGTDLVFFCENHANPGVPAQVVVPVKRVYFMLNTASLTRVDGDVPIPTFSMSMSLDVDSWTWSFTANVPGRALADLQPNDAGEPVELQIMVNGLFYRVYAESLSRSRAFNQDALTVRGRGKSATLDAPYAPVLNFGNTEDRLAQQLINDVLTFNGSPIGWDVNFELTDWLVPANLWSMQGTYIQAINQIAAAAGGYVQPDPVLQSLFIKARYPVAPWDWATDVTPDFELPSAVTTQEAIEWINKIRYNRVFVSGVNAGVLGQVTRTGTAGDILAPMVTDQLLTAVEAARQRGTAVLSDSGRQANVTLKLPVLVETGIIEPGKFVRYVDGATTRLGIVRSVSVDIGMPEVWQSIGVETHEPEPV
jgi:hypothetical protein